MDEVMFRTSRSFENLQVRALIVADQGKVVLRQCSLHARNAITYISNHPFVLRIYDCIKNGWIYIWDLYDNIKHFTITRVSFLNLYTRFVDIIRQNCSKPIVYVGCVGFIIGGLVGFGIGLMVQKQHVILRYMQAIQCLRYTGVESIAVVEDAIAPHECGANEVLVNIKAASVQIIDAQICNGYGHKFRHLLNKHNRYSKSDLPITLGRDCAGIVTDIGRNVTRIEVGDEVWLTVPFWASGTLSQMILVSENKVSRKPRTVGYEAACSLPYAGIIALNLLKRAKLTVDNCEDKKVLIQEGCTPVGCVLIQILTLWKADVTVVCFKRAVPVAKALGARDIIGLPETEEDGKHLILHTDNNYINMKNVCVKELEMRDKFDMIIITKDYGMNVEEFRRFCVNKDGVYSTLPPVLYSDSFGLFLNCLLWVYVHGRSLLQRMFKESVEDGIFDETHMCYVSLDRLTELVENGQLQTVVDKVYHPSDIDLALNHIRSCRSIGSTVISFR